MAAVDKIEEKRKPEDFIGHRNRGTMGAPPVAESSDLSEWQRSIKSRKSESPKILSGTATG